MDARGDDDEQSPPWRGQSTSSPRNTTISLHHPFESKLGTHLLGKMLLLRLRSSIEQGSDTSSLIWSSLKPNSVSSSSCLLLDIIHSIELRSCIISKQRVSLTVSAVACEKRIISKQRVSLSVSAAGSEKCTISKQRVSLSVSAAKSETKKASPSGSLKSV
eukprot:scaffold6519_cov156-Ochromonas_danica.AAC.5